MENDELLEAQSVEDGEPVKGRLIQFKQGLREDLPILQVGEPAFCTDDFTFWIGSDQGNKNIQGGSGGGSSVAVINNLTSTSTTSALSAYQGKVLKDTVDGIRTVDVIDNLTSVDGTKALSANQGRLLKQAVDAVQPTPLINNLTSNSTTSALTANQGRLLKQAIDSIETGSTEIVDTLTSDASDKALSAKQGKALKTTIDSLEIPSVINTLTSTSATSALSANQGRILKLAIDAVQPTTVVDNITSTSTTSALSANQGRVLQLAIQNHNEKIASNSELGHVKVDGETIIIDENGVISSLGGGGSVGGDTPPGIYVGSANTITGSTGSTIGNNHDVGGSYGLAVGSNNRVRGQYSVAIGNNNSVSSSAAFVTGSQNTSSGFYSYAGGYYSTASGYYSFAHGERLSVTTQNGFAIGRYNKALTGSATSIVSNSDLFVIGNGTSDTARSNAFRVNVNGSTYGVGAFNSSGADYAEYFEWLDGNKKSQKRYGKVVTLEGDKIRFAKNTDDYVLGVVSANPSVIGDSVQDDWQGKYLKDVWGNIKYEKVEKIVDVIDENNEITQTTVIEEIPKLNPKWDSSVEYLSRENRKEWTPVGLVGKLLILDDGTCEVNGYAKIGEVDGELTASKEKTQFRVMERISKNIVRVFIK